MGHGLSLEHIEIWVPWCIFAVDYKESLGVRRRRNEGDFFGSNPRDNRDASWMKRLQTIPSLKSIKHMAWNDRERPSQQSVPVKPLGVEGLDVYLDS